jgi:hypothetical protein
MIITDKFVLLAFPKTGTTFTTTALRSIHGNRHPIGRFLNYELQQKLFKKLSLERPGLREFRVPRPEPLPGESERMMRHGGYSDIPADARHLQVASIVRDPFTRYTSAYLFQMKTRKRIRHVAAPELLAKMYPGYPDIDFDQFYEMTHRFASDQYLRGLRPKIELGFQSAAFIHFYFKNPVDVFKKIDHSYIESGDYKQDLADISFMHQENLRGEFKAFLSGQGYPDGELKLVDTLKANNVANRSASEREPATFYTPGIRDRVLERDALLFKIFPEYLPDQ